MKATDEMLQDGLEAAYPGLENMSAASQAWAKDKVAKVTAAVLARVPTGWDKQTDADWSAATGCYTPALAKDHVEDLRRRVAELEQENEELGVQVSDAEGHAPDGKTVASLDAENAKLRAELADAQAQAKHAEALLAVYDHTQLEAAMVCLESLASYVGANGQDAPHTVEQLDERIRWGIDYNVGVWKRRAERAEAARTPAVATAPDELTQADLACIAIDDAVGREVGREVDREAQQKRADAAVVLIGTRPTDPAPADLTSERRGAGVRWLPLEPEPGTAYLTDVRLREVLQVVVSSLLIAYEGNGQHLLKGPPGQLMSAARDRLEAMASHAGGQ